MWHEKFTNKHGETNGDVLAWYLIRMVSSHRKRLRNA